MTETRGQLVWLRRGLSTFVGLLALAATCAGICGVLKSYGDVEGARAFRSITLAVAVADGACGISLLIGAVWSLIGLLEAPER